MIERALQALTEEEKYVRLKAMVAIGVEQTKRGEAVEYNEAFREEARQSARRRAAAGEKPSPDVCP